MIDLMREQQNEYGFIPSQAGSTWLKTDYGIEPGYYDTRFNTDFWLANINAAENFGVTGWLDKTRKLCGFFSSALPSSITFTFGASDDEGWLVQDYWHPERRVLADTRFTQPSCRRSRIPVPDGRRSE